MQGQHIGGDKPVIDNEKLPSANAPRHLLLQYRDEALFVEKVIRDDRTDVLLEIMTAVELVVNAMGFDVELGVNADGDFVFYDDSLSDEFFGETDEDTLDDEVEDILEVGAWVRILNGVAEGKTGVVTALEYGSCDVVLDEDLKSGFPVAFGYMDFELEVIG